MGAAVVLADSGDTNAVNPTLPLLDFDSGNGLESFVALFVDLAPLDAFTPLEWRIEVTNSGRNFNWRKGSGSSRVGRYGGLFGTLSEERQAQYERNKASYSRTKKKSTAAAQQTGRTERATNRPSRVPTSGNSSGTEPSERGVTPTA
jgi:hypothetical protein